MLNLIVVAHPDDEILGFGGTGYIEKQKGNTVQPLILCGEVEARRNKWRDKNTQLIKEAQVKFLIQLI